MIAPVLQKYMPPLVPILFFVLYQLNSFCTPSLAANSHDAILGQSLSTVKIVKAPQKVQENKQKSKQRKSSLHATGRNTGSVQAGQLDINSTNTVGASINSRHGAAVAIGAADLSRIKADAVGIQTTNRVGQGVSARGDGTRFRMGTVDMAGVEGGRIGIETDNTIRGNVSVKDGQDVSIGVVEMGTTKKEKDSIGKNDLFYGNYTSKIDDLGQFKKMGKYGQAIGLAQQNESGNGGEQDETNMICEDPSLLCNGKPKSECCIPGENDPTCHTIDGCSAVRDNYKNGQFIFGTTKNEFFMNGSRLPCNSHDQCYQTCGTDRQACDLQMYFDMIETCKAQDKSISDEQVRNPEEVWQDTKKGFVIFIDAKISEEIAGNAVAGALGAPMPIAMVIKFATKESIDQGVDLIFPKKKQTENRLKIGALTLATANLPKLSSTLSDTQKAVDHFADQVNNQISNATKSAKNSLHDSVQDTQHFIYDIVSGIETAGQGLNSLMGQVAQQIAPQQTLHETLRQQYDSQLSAPCPTSHFFSMVACNTEHMSKQVLTKAKQAGAATKWIEQKASSMLVKGVGSTMDYAGNLIAQDLRFAGALGGEYIKYKGYSMIDTTALSAKFLTSSLQKYGNSNLAALSFVANSGAYLTEKLGDLIFDCLATAETYYVGLRIFSGPFFRGNQQPCDDNKVDGDERCCVVNPFYKYHQKKKIIETIHTVNQLLSDFCQQHNSAENSW